MKTSYLDFVKSDKFINISASIYVDMTKTEKREQGFKTFSVFLSKLAEEASASCNKGGSIWNLLIL